MPEFNIFDDIGHIRSVLDSAREADQNIGIALQNLKDENAFKNITDTFGGSPNDYIIGPDKKLQIKGKDGNFRDVDPEKAYKEMMNNGDLKAALKDMGADPDEFTPNVDQLASDWEAQYKNLPGIKAIRDVDRSIANGREISDRLGADANPASKEELQQMLEKHKSEIGDQFNREVNRINRDYKTGSRFETVKSFLKYGFAIGAAGFGLAEAYEQIKNYQHNANGCWLIQVDTPGSSGVNKCKVKLLTCDKDDTTNIKQKQFTYCEDDSSDFPAKQCGPDQKSDCFSKQLCVQGATGATGATGCSGELGDLACKNAPPPNISDYCDCTKIECPKGWVLKKVDMNFMTAAQQLFGKEWAIAEHWIFTILKWIAIVIGALLGLYILWKIILALIERFSHGGGGGGGKNKGVRSRFKGKSK